MPCDIKFQKQPFSKFLNIYRKTLCWILQHRCFPKNIVKLLRTAFFMEHLRWLLLKFFDVIVELSLGPGQTSTKKFFCENSQGRKAVNSQLHHGCLTGSMRLSALPKLQQPETFGLPLLLLLKEVLLSLFLSGITVSNTDPTQQIDFSLPELRKHVKLRKGEFS